MTSIRSKPPNKLHAVSLEPDSVEENGHSPLPLTLKPNRFRSVGTQLLIWMVGGTLLGVGGIAFLFGEIVKYQTEDQIQSTLSSKVEAIDHRLSQAELLAETLRASIATLHRRKAETPETYRQLLLELFESRPSFVVGVGLRQTEYGILPQKQWFSAYYQLDSGDGSGELLPAPQQNIRDISPDAEADHSEAQPEEDWRDRPAGWSPPYLQGSRVQTTYTLPIQVNEAPIGTIAVDMDSTSFTDILSDPVIQQTGHFALLSAQGEVIDYPRDPVGVNARSYEAIPGLAAVWSQMQAAPSGLIEGETGYWAYAQVPEHDWITVAFVPYSAVFKPVERITVGGTVAVGLFLSIVVALVVRSLQRRLRPILEECHRLAATDPALLEQYQQRDEIDQLSAAFFNLVAQLQTNETQIRQEVARTVQAEEQLRQAAIAEQESQALQQEVAQLLDMVAAVEDGNLTVQAEVSPRLTGLVADTLNRLVERLGQIIAAVLYATEQVTDSAQQLEQLAIAVVDNTQQQAQSVSTVRTLMEEINTLSQDSLQQAAATDTAVEQTQAAIAQGQQEIITMTAGLSHLQQGAYQIVKRTQTLNDYVDLATQFTKDQKRVAALTRVLAMNASMLVTRATEQQDPAQFASLTQEFEVIAGQVNELAAQTNQNLLLLQQRTDQIQTVVSGLNYDIQAINQQVNGFSHGVEQSQQVFNHIQAVTEQVAQLGQRVTQSNQAIATAAQTTLQTVRDIAQVASETAKRAQLTQAQAQHMEQLADTLLHQVEFFRLPSGPEAAPIPAARNGTGPYLPLAIANHGSEDPTSG